MMPYWSVWLYCNLDARRLWSIQSGHRKGDISAGNGGCVRESFWQGKSLFEPACTHIFVDGCPIHPSVPWTIDWPTGWLILYRKFLWCLLGEDLEMLRLFMPQQPRPRRSSNGSKLLAHSLYIDSCRWLMEWWILMETESKLNLQGKVRDWGDVQRPVELGKQEPLRVRRVKRERQLRLNWSSW